MTAEPPQFINVIYALSLGDGSQGFFLKFHPPKTRKLKMNTENGNPQSRKNIIVYFLVILVLIGGSFLIPGMIAFAETVTPAYFVSTTGSDTNPGTLMQPFRTIQYGVNKLVAGDTLYIRGGTYTERVTITKSGTASAPITISSYPGETAIMDGSGLSSTLSVETPMINLRASYVIVQNLELTFPRGRGIYVYKSPTLNASHNIIRNNNIHHMFGSGINVWGDYNLVENNKLWKTMLQNDCDNRSSNDGINCAGYSWSGTITIGDSTYPYYGLNTTIRNNQVYQSYGEGILCMYTDYATIEGNRVWDSWALGIYPDHCSYTSINNNLVYYTSDTEYWRFATSSSPSPAMGILLSNESNIPSHPIGHDINVFNNIIVNAFQGIYFWSGQISGSALINVTIANNTIVNNGNYRSGIFIDSPINASHQNTLIKNNLILETYNWDPGVCNSCTGITFSNNLWSRSPSVSGAGDIVANPQLSDPPHAIDLDQAAHPLDPHWYQLTSGSPAIGHASPLSFVTNDYFNNPRDNAPDIGADEFK
jgi:parallel beta-helix repeat protein